MLVKWHCHTIEQEHQWKEEGLRSLSKCVSHTTSAVALARALYSASVEDLATVGCFFADQETRFEPR